MQILCPVPSGSLKNDLHFLLGHADDADDAPVTSDSACQGTYFSLIILHGALMALGWGFFLPWGAFIARYARHNDPLWFNLHKLFQVCVWGAGGMKIFGCGNVTFFKTFCACSIFLISWILEQIVICFWLKFFRNLGNFVISFLTIFQKDNTFF